MKVLAVDSSAKAASAAIVENDKIIGSFFVNTSLTHSQTLVPMIDSILKNTTTDINSIDVFAVSAGPGSFTGVRIGVSAIKGIAMPLKKDCISVSTLESMAYNFIQDDCIVASLMDARCNQVYNAVFKISDGHVSRLCDDRALPIDELLNDLKKYEDKIVLVGDGAEICYNSYKEELSNVVIAPEHLRFQNAVGVAFASFDKERISADKLMSTYLRLPQAERELKKRLESKK